MAVGARGARGYRSYQYAEGTRENAGTIKPPPVVGFFVFLTCPEPNFKQAKFFVKAQTRAQARFKAAGLPELIRISEHWPEAELRVTAARSGTPLKEGLQEVR